MVVGMNISTSPVSTDVVVIGAGYAGLSAALHLHDLGAQCIVLEAATRVGGRIFTERRDDGLVIDHGGQWVGPAQKGLLELAERFDCDTFKTWETGQHIEVWSDGARVPYVGLGPEQGQGVDEYDRIVEQLSAMAATVDVDEPWKTPRFAEWDAISAGDFFDQQTSDPAAHKRLALAVQGVWCCEPNDISYFHLLFYIASAGGYEQLMDTQDCAQDARFSWGAVAPAEGIADVLADRVRLGDAVEAITQTSAGVVVRTRSGVVVEAQKAVVALPPPALRDIEFEPELPQNRLARLAKTSMGRVIKIHAIYDEPFWREEGLAGIATCYGDGPVGVIFDNSPEDGSRGVLVAFVYGDREQKWQQADAGDRQAAVLASLAAAIGPRAGSPTEFTEQLWNLDPFAQGGYEGYVVPGGWTLSGTDGWREPTGAIHWAGTETASRWNGYMEGAIESGRRAANEATAGLRQVDPVT